MSDVACYAQPGKERSRVVLSAFADGSGGRVVRVPPATLDPKYPASAFYGVIGIEYLLFAAREKKLDWYYGDNAFFDSCRDQYFRFAKNAFQPSSFAPPSTADRDRFDALGLSIKPWRAEGDHIVVVEQSEYFLDLIGDKRWLVRTLGMLAALTTRPLRVRRWLRNKRKASETLPADLEGAWALVTHASAAANEAALAGIPVFVSGDCAAHPIASGTLDQINSPRLPDGREDWAASLAAHQWTLAEIAQGAAWEKLNGNR